MMMDTIGGTTERRTPTADDRDELDRALLAKARAGNEAAFSDLYALYRKNMHRLAVVLVGQVDADDLVSETFARVYERMRQGGGPTELFGPYLRTVARHIATDHYRSASRRTQPAADIEEALRDSGRPYGDVDPAIESSADSYLVREAFESLPEQWRTVLWCTSVEGMTPAALANWMGSTPNAVASVAKRARAGLREAYLTAHVAERGHNPRCSRYVPDLARMQRGTLPGRRRTAVMEHVHSCAECQQRIVEIDEINTSLPVILPLALIPDLVAMAGHSQLTAAASALTATASATGAATTSASLATGLWIGGAAVGVAAIAILGVWIVTSNESQDAGTTTGAVSTVATSDVAGDESTSAVTTEATATAPDPAPTTGTPQTPVPTGNRPLAPDRAAAPAVVAEMNAVSNGGVHVVPFGGQVVSDATITVTAPSGTQWRDPSSVTGPWTCTAQGVVLSCVPNSPADSARELTVRMCAANEVNGSVTASLTGTIDGEEVEVALEGPVSISAGTCS